MRGFVATRGIYSCSGNVSPCCAHIYRPTPSTDITDDGDKDENANSAIANYLHTHEHECDRRRSQALTVVEIKKVRAVSEDDFSDAALCINTRRWLWKMTEDAQSSGRLASHPLLQQFAQFGPKHSPLYHSAPFCFPLEDSS